MLQQSLQGALRMPQGKQTDKVFLKWNPFENETNLKYMSTTENVCMVQECLWQIRN